MKKKRAYIEYLDDSKPYSKWFVENVELGQLKDPKVLTCLLIVIQLERRGQLSKAGKYRIDYTSVRDFKLFRAIDPSSQTATQPEGTTVSDSQQFENIKNTAQETVQEHAPKVQSFVEKHKHEIVTGVAIVSTLAALRYRKQLKGYKGKVLLEVTKADLNNFAKTGGYTIYSVGGQPLVLQHLSTAMRFDNVLKPSA